MFIYVYIDFWDTMDWNAPLILNKNKRHRYLRIPEVPIPRGGLSSASVRPTSQLNLPGLARLPI